MNFEYKAPTISHTKEPFTISHKNQEIGEIERYFKKDIRTTTQFDVNLIVKDFISNDFYEIDQTNFTLLSGGEWTIKKNDTIVGEIKTPKGFFKVHQIITYIEGQPEIKLKAKFDGTGIILDNGDREIGNTRRSTSVKRVYEGEIEEDYLTISWILFFSLVHTFWCGFNRK